MHRIYKLTTPFEPPYGLVWPRWVPSPPVRARGGNWAPLEGFSRPYSANFVKSTKYGQIWAFYDDTPISQNGPKSDAWDA